MNKKQQQVRWEKWHFKAVEKYGERYGLGGFSSTVRFIISAVLNRDGLFESDFIDSVETQDYSNLTNSQKTDKTKAV